MTLSLLELWFTLSADVVFHGLWRGSSFLVLVLTTAGGLYTQWGPTIPSGFKPGRSNGTQHELVEESKGGTVRYCHYAACSFSP